MCAAHAAWAGGLLTNTNTNIAFNRNFARDGVIAIDGVYSNPAGVAFLDKGFHLSLNIQNVYQTRTIESGMTVPAFEGTPFARPFALGGGNAEGIKTFVGKASVPILPSVQAALNYDKWGFQAGFSLIGGGKCTFNNGLGSFERQIAMVPALLYQSNRTVAEQYGIDLGLGTTTPGYTVDSYIKGKQYVFGFQFGATYKLNEQMAVYGGFRFNYIWNSYLGNISNISANINGKDENLYEYLGNLAGSYKTKADVLAANAAAAGLAGDTETQAKLERQAALCNTVAGTMENTKASFADRQLDCTQNGWGITPIIGLTTARASSTSAPDWSSPTT